MSGIYGYYTKHAEDDSSARDEALKYWNANYGSRVLTRALKGGRLSVNLEHFSARVKEQTAFLENDTYLAVIDALLYNREEFDAADALSDEELLFDRVSRGGFSALKEINGDFSGVFYRKDSGEFTLLTDHLGIRPLFWYADAEKFIFSTDMRALEAIPDCTLTINEKHLFEQMTQTLLCSPSDFAFNELHVVEKGCFVTVKPDLTSEKHSYWTVGQHRIRLKDEAAYRKELYRLVSDAISRRAAAVDGPLGAELSGGLDSSVISILLNRTGRECSFFSWSAPAEKRPIVHENDERVIIDAICRQENIRVHYNTESGGRNVTEFLGEMNPPYGNTTTIRIGSRWFSKQGVRGVFAGHGGDEGISHRCGLYELWYHGEYLPYLKAVYRSYGKAHLRLLRTVYSTLRNIPKERASHSVIRGYEGILDGFLNPDYAARISQAPTVPFTFGYDAAAYVKQDYTNNRPRNTAYQAAEYGVRYLFPYLDYRVIDFAVSIPRWLYNDGVQKRKIYIDTFRDIVPEELIRYFAKATVSTGDEPNDVPFLREWLEGFAAELDPSLWAPYLNVEALKNFRLPDTLSEEDYNKYTLTLLATLYCAQLQYTWKHAGEAAHEL